MNSRDLDTVLDVFTAMQKSALLLQQFYKKCGIYYTEHARFFTALSADVDGFIKAVEEMRMIIFDHPNMFTVTQGLNKASLAVGKLASELQYKETEIKRKNISPTDVLLFARTMEALILEAEYPGLLDSRHETYSNLVEEVPRMSHLRRERIAEHLAVS